MINGRGSLIDRHGSLIDTINTARHTLKPGGWQTIFDNGQHGIQPLKCIGSSGQFLDDARIDYIIYPD